MAEDIDTRLRAKLEEAREVRARAWQGIEDAGDIVSDTLRSRNRLQAIRCRKIIITELEKLDGYIHEMERLLQG